MIRYTRSAGVEAAPMQDETVLYNPASKQFCLLNETAAFLWDLLEAPQTEEDLAAELCDAFDGVDAEMATRDVRRTLQQLTDLGIVARVPVE